MELLTQRQREDRPWGSFDRFTLNESTTVKIVRLLPNKRLSLQKHAHRAEFWRVIEGSGIATVGDAEREIKVGDEVTIPEGSLHRLAGGDTGLAVLEIAFGTFDESDIERVEDDFGRATP
jgi:mannose-6-phosphate isomerase-like protein (cupin superfamily)